MNPGTDAIWLIWSNYHRAWWGPVGVGYATLANAGRHTLAEALDWCSRRSKDPNDERSNPPEMIVPAPEAVEAWLALGGARAKLCSRCGTHPALAWAGYTSCSACVALDLTPPIGSLDARPEPGRPAYPDGIDGPFPGVRR